MLVGEPGIGKSALCQRLATDITAQDGMPLFGHCYEAGSSALPYQPFVEALTAYAREQELGNLALELGQGAAELARIVPLISERLQVEVSPPGDPTHDRLLLMRAIMDFLRAVAASRPLVLLLEDLHDADRGTLDLLMHVAREVDTARLLVVGTYRDVEVDRAHPLSAAVAELRRGKSFTRIRLQGLPLEDVHQLLRTASQHQVSASLAELVYRRTDGNPLFVHELLRFALEDGLIERRDGALRRVGQDALAGRIPEGLRDVVGKRLSRLGPHTNRALSVASVIGREFQVEVLQQVLLANAGGSGGSAGRGSSCRNC